MTDARRVRRESGLDAPVRRALSPKNNLDSWNRLRSAVVSQGELASGAWQSGEGMPLTMAG